MTKHLDPATVAIAVQVDGAAAPLQVECVLHKLQAIDFEAVCGEGVEIGNFERVLLVDVVMACVQEFLDNRRTGWLGSTGVSMTGPGRGATSAAACGIEPTHREDERASDRALVRNVLALDAVRTALVAAGLLHLGQVALVCGQRNNRQG